MIAVEDTRKALGQLAAAYRQILRLPVVAVGGSNGKTTAKELIASVLRQKLATLWSEASFNNDIGVPLTLLRLEKSHQAAVLEAGTNHPGELAPLVKMIQPKYGVITNIGREHLEFFGDVAGVAREEGWLAELLPADGKLFVNGDNEWTSCVAERTRAAVVRVGFGEENDWRARGSASGQAGRDVSGGSAEGRIYRRVSDQLLGPPSGGECPVCDRGREELGLSRPAVAGAWPNASRRRCGCNSGKPAACACSTTPTTPTRIRCWRRWKRFATCHARPAGGGAGRHGRTGRAQRGGARGSRPARGGIGHRPVVRRRQNGAGDGAAARDAGLNRVIEFADVEAAAAAVKSFVEARRCGVVEGVARVAAGTHRGSIESRRSRTKRLNVLLFEPIFARLVGGNHLGGSTYRPCGSFATSRCAAPGRRSRRWF